ncbi:MAG: MGMT family protein, partial [Betaproteobacteria bacterium]|nr:MGMT family protein [Betaproteobacteria bacterium]
MEAAKPILRRKYLIGSQQRPIWVQAFGADDQIAEIVISATALAKPQLTAGAAARQLAGFLQDYFAGRFERLGSKRLPLAVNGSRPHQRLCMEFLAGIPLGEVRTYQQEAQAVAKARGSRPSARAAGQANSRN